MSGFFINGNQYQLKLRNKVHGRTGTFSNLKLKVQPKDGLFPRQRSNNNPGNGGGNNIPSNIYKNLEYRQDNFC